MARERLDVVAAILGANMSGGGGGGGGIDHYSQLPDKPKINGNVLSGDKSSEQLGLQSQLSWDEAPTENSQKPVKSGGIYTALAKKVTSETGKGLSSNDYTTEEKTKLAGLSNYDDTALAGRVTANETAISGKVDKETGKGLSTNDYTNSDKDIVDGVTTALADKADVDDVIDSATYDSTNHQILFKNGTTTLFSLDAAAFVKDGMVDTVTITSGNLVITFNTDAGKQDISIPLTDIFNPANYYDKDNVDGLLADKVSKSNTAGLLKNDGTVDTTTYATKASVDAIKDGQSIDSFADVETALGGKADKVTSAVNGNFAGLDANGNLTDSGVSAGGVLTAKGTINESIDFNTIVAPGVYGLGSQNYIVNGPTGATYGVLTVFCNRNSNVSYNYIVQTYKNRANSKSWYRVSTNGGTEWTDWFYSSTASEGAADILSAGTDTTQRSWSAKMLKDEFRGGKYLPLVNLGTEYTAELKADISSGKFEKAVVGGYLTINGHVYYFAHPDYWLHTGDTECTTHHMLVIPAEGIGIGKMNNTNITTGAYAGSDMKTGNNSNTALATAAAQIKADFGASNILTHRELFANAVTDGKVSGWAWADSDIDLMNEVMVYGCNAWASHPGYETGIDKCQIKLFQERPDLITNRALWWLRSVVSAANFALVRGTGEADSSDASRSRGVRPAFAIC